MAKGLKGAVMMLVGLLAPVKKLTKPGVALGWSPPVRWLLHFAIIIGICIGLGFLSTRLFRPGGAWENWRFLSRPGYDWLYLPGLFLLFPYITGWIIWMIWRLA